LEKGEVAYKSIEEAALDLSRKIIEHSAKDKSIIIFGYSMGAVIAFEMAKILEAQNKYLQLILVDRNVQSTSDRISGSGLGKRDKEDLVRRYKQLVTKSNTDEKELEIFLSNNIKILRDYNVNGKIKSPIYAIEAVGNKVKTNMQDWKKFTDGQFKISFIKGDHWELFNDDRLSQVSQLISTHCKVTKAIS
jgi:surfactin synthase thioesterase subunit